MRAFLATFLFLTFAQASSAACVPQSVDLRGPWGKARFNIEIADDDAERAQGLMHRTEMARSAGMLFIYDRPQALAFWMRNTLIELDMLFVDATGIVRHIHHRAQPLDETAIYGGENLLAVLEINGGLARAMGISVGTQMRHPAFAASGPVWPCS